MAKPKRIAEAEEGAKNAKKYAMMLRKDGTETPKAAALYEKHKGNSTFKVVADLARGVAGALYAGKRVHIELRMGDKSKSKEPKLTRLPTRPLKEPNKN